MGSALAGAKAGLVASLFFAGSISVFNIVLLLAFKTQALSYISTISSCTGAVESCYSSLLFVFVPIDDFIRIFVIGILFAIAVGVYFDVLPGPSYMRRTLLGALIMVVLMLFLGLYGEVTSTGQAVLMVIYEGIAVVFYAFIMARLYRRFTREVEFQSIPAKGKLFVNGRDMTGRKRTFQVGSNQKVEAEGEAKAFRGWLVSGGVVVKEPKEPKTSIQVNGDGLLKLT